MEKRTTPRKTGLSPWREYVFSLYRKKQEKLSADFHSPIKCQKKEQHEGETPNKKEEEEEKQKTNHRSLFLFSQTKL